MKDVTAAQQRVAQHQFDILEDAIIDVQHCIESLRKDKVFVDEVYDLVEIRTRLCGMQEEAEKVLRAWDRQQEQIDRMIERRSM